MAVLLREERGGIRVYDRMRLIGHDVAIDH